VEKTPERKLLFEFNSHEEPDRINMIRVYSDNTYTADGRGREIIEWKMEDNTIYWKRSHNTWKDWSSNDFYINLMSYIDGQILGEEHG
jgi:hypothetical protein